MNGARKAVFMTIDAFLILLWKRRIEGLLFFADVQQREADENALRDAMTELIRDGVLIPGEEGRFKFSAETEEMLAVLEKASGTCILRFASEEFPTKCLCVANGRGVLISRDSHNRELLRLQGADEQDLLEEIVADLAMQEDGPVLFLENYRREILSEENGNRETFPALQLMVEKEGGDFRFLFAEDEDGEVLTGTDAMRKIREAING